MKHLSQLRNEYCNYNIVITLLIMKLHSVSLLNSENCHYFPHCPNVLFQNILQDTTVHSVITTLQFPL